MVVAHLTKMEKNKENWREKIWRKKIEKIIMVQNNIFHLYGGGPLDIPAVDKSKDGDAEDGEQFDNLEIEDLVNVFSYFKTYTIHQLFINILRYSYFQS